MILAPLCNIKYNRHTLGVYRNKNGSLGFPVKGAEFGGASVRTHARTPKFGYLPRKFLKSHKNPNAIHEDRWYGLWAESSSREKALKNFNQGADPVCWSSGAIPRKSITGIVPPLLMIHLLFWRSSWAIKT
jgi:hypothetical protein